MWNTIDYEHTENFRVEKKNFVS